MKHQQFYLPRSGKLVTQLPGGLTFAYDLHLGHLRDHWKGLALLTQAMPKKTSFRASKWPGSLGPKKLPQKNCQPEITILSQWNGGWPPIST